MITWYILQNVYDSDSLGTQEKYIVQVLFYKNINVINSFTLQIEKFAKGK